VVRRRVRAHDRFPQAQPQETNMDKSRIAGALALMAALAVPVALYAEQRASEEALSRAVGQAQLPLERGIAASAGQGTPISAKYEFDDDDDDELQLSVYTMNGDPSQAFSIDFETGDVRARDGAFAEIIVDHATGKIGKIVPIKDGGDLADATRQSKAMALAKRSLEAATASAVSANRGYRAVSAMPAVKDGHPIAEIGLTDGRTRKIVFERLD
jgi:hypothetical protein